MHVPLIMLMVGLFPTAVRVTGFGVAYNTSQLLFAALAPIIGNGLWDALSASGAHASPLVDTAPAIWNYVGIGASGGAFVGTLCAVRAGVLPRLSTIREERVC